MIYTIFLYIPFDKFVSLEHCEFTNIRVNINKYFIFNYQLQNIRVYLNISILFILSKYTKILVILIIQ